MLEVSDLNVVKKDGTLQEFDIDKVKRAVGLSSSRVLVDLTDEEWDKFLDSVEQSAITLATKNGTHEVDIKDMHSIVENNLDSINPKVAKSYRDYRDYKVWMAGMMDSVFRDAQRIMYLGDRENANADSALVSTKRSLIYSSLNKELYKRFFLSVDELQAIRDGYIYIHDMSSRRDTINCCLCNITEILNGGFEMSNQWYNEPKTLDTAFDVIGDIVLNAASQQYGGFTVPQVDEVLNKYAELSYKKYYNEAIELLGTEDKDTKAKAKEYALGKVRRDFQQGFQGWEYKFNTVASSRGDYPFITMTFGLGTKRFEKMASIEMCKVRAGGQGKPGFKKLVLFPKLVFLYDSRIHGPKKKCRSVYNAAIECSMKAMYPDWLSLEPGSYVGDMYQKYGRVISPMGCRAFLSPWYERGGMEPADEDDKPVFIGRFNLGAISLNLPMIFAKAHREDRDFYEVLDEYLEMIRKIHKKTYNYLAEMRAGINPLMFCQGGAYMGHLNPEEKIGKILKPCTLSFGYTALNELQELYNGKSIYEDGQFAIDVMKFINKRVNDFKVEDGLLYAIYGTPAESLCGTQVEQFKKQFGIVHKVSDREYFTNSFHCHVSEDITPTEKQDAEKRFWDLTNGGKIQYVRYRSDKNKKAFETLIDRAMKLGFYEGVNMEKDYCASCGHSGIDFEGGICPICGSNDIVQANRVCGYLGWSRVHDNTRLNDAKLSEIKDRVSM